MIILILSTFAIAESTSSTGEESVATIPLLYSGTDDEASLVRTSMAADINVELLNLQTIVDLTGSAQPQLLSVTDGERKDEDLKVCTGNAITNKHIQNYTQTAFNHFSYYELEKSDLALNKAESSLVCLQELFNDIDIRNMYYLKGILEQTKGNNDASQQAFSSAIRLKPDLQWNELYSPDAKPNFDAAKEEFLNLDSISLTLTPKAAASSLWVNGTPLLEIDNPTIYAGTNIIQIVGLETTTYEITVPSDVDEVRLVLPSTLPNIAYTWAEDEDQGAELSEALSIVLKQDTPVYIHNSGKVWTSDLKEAKWTELEVPKFAETRLNAKKITGQTLFWTGLATSAVGLGLSTNYYMQGQQTYQASATTQDWTEFKDHRKNLTALEGQYQASILTMVGGLGLTTLGYTLAF